MLKRAIIIVLDSCGVGALPDADLYGDAGCNTLGHLADAVGGISLPNLARTGFGNIIPVKGVNAEPNASGSWGKSLELSKGKDTNTGHYEIAGLIVEKPFKVYPSGFPESIIKKFCGKFGFKGVLGNKAASGTEIIKEFGEAHIRDGLPIVYTSADSVFQIAAHEDVIPPERLWRISADTLRVFDDPTDISRVIARPFIGDVGNFSRTANRRDFTLGPWRETLLDHLKNAGHEVYGIGKIEDIYNGQGITKAVHTESNRDGILKTIEALRTQKEGLIFTNLVDFDMKYGHRNDPKGYAAALEEFDSFLPRIFEGMNDGDILIITADHGCDPTFLASTDHSREYIPILIYGKGLCGGVDLGVRKSFADIGASVADWFGLDGKMECGESFISRRVK